MLAVAAAALCSFALPTRSAGPVQRAATVSSRVAEARAISPDDDMADVLHADSWASARGVAGRPIFSHPSSVDSSTLVEVHAHPAGWRSLVYVSDRVGVQSVVKFDAETGLAQPTAIGNEYLKTMAAIALSTRLGEPLRRILMLGMGAGSLPSLLSCCCPEATTIDCVELDASVADAACGPLGLDTSRITVHVDDALAWLSRRAELAREESAVGATAPCHSYDVICVDIFDGSNRTPEGFYSTAFLRDLRACLDARGVVVHNLHSGGADLDRRLDEACAAYSEAFPGAACRVPALRRGNTVVAAAASEEAFASLDLLQAAAQYERQRRGLLFDASARVAGLRQL